MSREALDWLMGSGEPGKPFSFKEKGASIKGKIVSYKLAPVLTPEGVPKLFPSGTPIQMTVMLLQTELRDPDDPEDEGLRRVYIDKRGMVKAVREAITASEWRGNLTGGTLGLKYTDDLVPRQRGHHGEKVFVAKFLPPSVEAPFEENEPEPDREPGSDDDFGLGPTPPDDDIPF